MSITAPSVVDQMSAALSVASLRHQVVASNIANRDTVGYQRLALRFAQAWNGASDTAPATAQVVPEAPQPGAAMPSLEQDMVTLSGNALHYQALTRSLGRYFAIAQLVADGRRG